MLTSLVSRLNTSDMRYAGTRTPGISWSERRQDRGRYDCGCRNRPTCGTRNRNRRFFWRRRSVTIRPSGSQGCGLSFTNALNPGKLYRSLRVLMVFMPLHYLSARTCQVFKELFPYETGCFSPTKKSEDSKLLTYCICVTCDYLYHELVNRYFW